MGVTLLVRLRVCSGCYFIGPFKSLQWMLLLLFWSLRKFVVDVTLLVPSRVCNEYCCYFIGPFASL